MGDLHEFQFDVDRAYEDQLADAMDRSPELPLDDPQAPNATGVYVLYRNGAAVYVGKAERSLRSRLRDHRNKIRGRVNISLSEMTCGYLTIGRLWEVARAEDALIRRIAPEWNGISGFSMHAPGAGRPGMPDYRNEWEERFPRAG